MENKEKEQIKSEIEAIKNEVIARIQHIEDRLKIPKIAIKDESREQILQTEYRELCDTIWDVEMTPKEFKYHYSSYFGYSKYLSNRKRITLLYLKQYPPKRGDEHFYFFKEVVDRHNFRIYGHI